MDEHDSRKEKLYLIGRSGNNLWTEGSEYKARGASMGGDIPVNHLLTYLEKSIKSADSIDIIVSFLMESGVRLLLPALKNALDRGAQCPYPAQVRAGGQSLCPSLSGKESFLSPKSLHISLCR